MSIFIKIKLWNMKRKARSLYYAIERESDLGCGIGLAEYIRPQLAVKRLKLESIINEIKAIKGDK